MLKIALGYKEVKGPWGGGNRFIKSLKNELLDYGYSYTTNLRDKDIDIILLTDPRYRLKSVSFSIANIVYYKLFINPKVIVVHRINECDERKNTKFMNSILTRANWCADYTVFVGTWLKKLSCWKDNIRTPFQIILNGSDDKIFNYTGYKIWDGKGPMKLVTHHWGGNWMKGFDIYTQIDQMLEKQNWKSKFSLTYIGNLPKGFKFKNVKYVKPLDELKLANELKKHHVYITASINEPGGNHQNEGALCGLPLLYRNSGSMPEYCKGYGIMFNEKNLILSLHKMRVEYKNYVIKMKAFSHNSKNTSLKYIKLFHQLYHEPNCVHCNTRFYKSFIKTIKSIFII